MSHFPPCPVEFPTPPIGFGAERAARVRYQAWVALCRVGATGAIREEHPTAGEGVIPWAVSGAREDGTRHNYCARVIAPDAADVPRNILGDPIP